MGNSEKLSEELKVREAYLRYDGNTLARALTRKFTRRLFGRTTHQLGSVAHYNGIAVFDRVELDGGGRDFGQDCCRVLRELRPEGCERLLEICAGPGYIGYALLATGFCRHLVLADINPMAIQAARKTARVNRLQDRVTIYQSDGLHQIGPAERWDVVVSNPPHFLPRQGEDDLLLYDEEWRFHREFLTCVKAFLKPGAVVLLQESHAGSTPGLFEPWITAGGGHLEQCMSGPDGKYYLVCKYD
jgi:16S rRNA G966 N2-methylase RsmD